LPLYADINAVWKDAMKARDPKKDALATIKSEVKKKVIDKRRRRRHRPRRRRRARRAAEAVETAQRIHRRSSSPAGHVILSDFISITNSFFVNNPCAFCAGHGLLTT
jgi:hypothetical protein